MYEIHYYDDAGDAGLLAGTQAETIHGNSLQEFSPINLSTLEVRNFPVALLDMKTCDVCNSEVYYAIGKCVYCGSTLLDRDDNFLVLQFKNKLRAILPGNIQLSRPEKNWVVNTPGYVLIGVQC